MLGNEYCIIIWQVKLISMAKIIYKGSSSEAQPNLFVIFYLGLHSCLKNVNFLSAEQVSQR